MKWLKYKDVNRELAIPIARVIANPLTLLLPSVDNTRAAIIVVTFESIIVQKALLKPLSSA